MIIILEYDLILSLSKNGHVNKTILQVTYMKFVIKRFSPASWASSSLGSNILLRTLFSDILSIFFPIQNNR